MFTNHNVVPLFYMHCVSHLSFLDVLMCVYVCMVRGGGCRGGRPGAAGIVIMPYCLVS